MKKHKKMLVLEIEASNLLFITTVVTKDHDEIPFNKIIKKSSETKLNITRVV